MSNLIQVGGVLLGGGIGAVLRFGCVLLVGSMTESAFPWGILLVNVLGSFLAGFIMAIFMVRLELSIFWRACFSAGFLGSFTTFSSFSVDTFLLVQSGAYATAAANVVGSILAGIVAAAGGFYMGKVFLA